MSLSTGKGADFGDVAGNPDHHDTAVTLSQNNMDSPEHKTIYERGLAIRKQVVGDDYVANALEKGRSDFLRPLQQLATVQITPLFSIRVPGFEHALILMLGSRLGHSMDTTRVRAQDKEYLELRHVDGFGTVD